MKKNESIHLPHSSMIDSGLIFSLVRSTTNSQSRGSYGDGESW